MKIIEKFAQKQAQLRDAPAPVLAFLGDSVTHGRFEIYDRSDRVGTEFRPADSRGAVSHGGAGNRERRNLRRHGGRRRLNRGVLRAG